MHDCALGRDGEPSAACVEHTYYAGDGIDRKTRVGGEDKMKSQNRPHFFYL